MCSFSFRWECPNICAQQLAAMYKKSIEIHEVGEPWIPCARFKLILYLRLNLCFFLFVGRGSIFAPQFFQFDEDKYLFYTTDKFIVNKFRLLVLLLAALSLAKVSAFGPLLIFLMYWENVILHFSYWDRRTGSATLNGKYPRNALTRDVEWRRKNVDNDEKFSVIKQLIIEYNNGKANKSHIVCALCGLTGKVWAVWMRIWRG